MTGLPVYAKGGRQLLHLGLAYSHVFKGANALDDLGTDKGIFKRVKLKENFSLSQGTWGALELAARYSHLDLNDNGVRGGIENNVTLGANWYLYSNLRLMLNWVHAQRAHSQEGDGGRADIVEGRVSLDF